MASWLSSGDARAFKSLLALFLMYGAMSHLAYTVIHMRHVRPLGSDAPPNRFSEARAIEHIRHLTVDIDGRQVILACCCFSIIVGAGIWDCDVVSISGRTAGTGRGGEVYKKAAGGVGRSGGAEFSVSGTGFGVFRVGLDCLDVKFCSFSCF